MKRIISLICLMALLMSGIDASAQQRTYPEDMLNFEDSYCIPVNFKGKAPNICDFVSSLIEDESMLMDSGDFIDAWNHYLRHEPQEPESNIVVDEKNGYVSMTSEFTDDYEDEVHVSKGIYEMCYWNCADGKHKLFAVNFNYSMDGRFKVGQTTGLSLYIYDNGRHIMKDLVEEDMGIGVDPDTDENYGYDKATGLHLVKDRETGKPLTLNDEDFFRWLDEQPVVTYWLPSKGKDIVAEVHYVNRTDTIRFAWDGMKFIRQ